MGRLSKGLLEGLVRFGFVLGDFGKHLRKCSFALDWILSERGGNSLTGCLNKSYLLIEGRKIRPRLTLYLIEKQPSLLLAKIEGCLAFFCNLDHVHILSVFRHRVASFLSFAVIA